ncbi:hypothetical protein BJ742DRAFT_819780 [Cladochytrium replicatum]|nr:hypothetical protein BJ742DRAFT_819780 [Cladochytrium replicatum]
MRPSSPRAVNSSNFFVPTFNFGIVVILWIERSARRSEQISNWYGFASLKKVFCFEHIYIYVRTNKRYENFCCLALISYSAPQYLFVLFFLVWLKSTSHVRSCSIDKSHSFIFSREHSIFNRTTTLTMSYSFCSIRSEVVLHIQIH